MKRTLVFWAIVITSAAWMARVVASDAPTGGAVSTVEAPEESALAPAANARPGADLDLAGLKKLHQNAVVKIEFTAVQNKEETKMNPTKSERYYSGSEPPHGSGFFISESDILTNAHVVEMARAGSIRVKSPATGNVEFRADVIGIGGSETIDIALLRLPEDEIVRFKKRSGLRAIPWLRLGDSSGIRQADALAIFGYPQASDDLKIIQAKVTGRQYLKMQDGRLVCGHQFIEVGPGGVVQQGNSGGPALDAAGGVVGVPSRALWGGEQGWLIPADIVTHFLEQIRASEAGRKRIVLPSLGLAVTENFAGTSVWSGAPEDCVLYELGVVVLDVIPGSLAEDWGIEPRDILVGFANRQKGLSCALDFKGYRVVTGKMKVWPPEDAEADAASAPAAEPEADAPQDAPESESGDAEGSEMPKLHLSEMVLTSNVGDAITLWTVRKGRKGIEAIRRALEDRQPVPLPHQGPYEKPRFELWGDFVAQDFDDYNVPLFEVPVREVLKGGALVTFVEPNSLASRRGMEPRHRNIFGFAFFLDMSVATQWVIIDSVNESPVRNLQDLKDALRRAEKAFAEKTARKDYDPARRTLMKERYVEIGFRTNTRQGDVFELRPAFPIDEALECRAALNLPKE